MDNPPADDVIERGPPVAATAASPSRRKQWLKLGAIMLAGAVFGYFGATLIGDLFRKPEGAVDLGLMGLALPLIWLLVVGWHELGHIVGGWLTGARFLLWVVGPLMLRRTPTGLRFGRNRSVNVGGGLAVCVPTDMARFTPGRTAVMILGGPISSLLLALLAALGLIASGGSLGPVVHNVVALTAILSGLIFGLTLAPFVAGGFKSDGRRAWDLLRGGAQSDQEAALLLLTTSGMGGVRPADYDPQIVQRVLSLNDGSIFDLSGRLMVFYYHADREEWTSAQARLDEVLAGEDQLAPYLRDILRCEYAWLLATRTRRADLARAWLVQAGKLDIDPATRLRAEAAVLLAEGEVAAAQAKIAAAHHALEHRSISPVKNQFAESALGDLQAKAKHLSGLPR
jgi:hypothetical protein